ncbi:MAG: thioredoxin family protein [Myxococcales bacterium]|nr:thioredoxin family protein [Myxococcales bacterium]
MLRRQVVLAALWLLVASGAVRMARAEPDPPPKVAELLFFWGLDCPHCERARPFVRELEKEYPTVQFSWWEVKRDREGRRRFAQKVRELGIEKPSVPTFVCGKRYLVGFTEGKSEKKLRRLIDACLEDRSPE